MDRPRWHGCLVLVAAVGLAACGGGDDDETEAPVRRRDDPIAERAAELGLPNPCDLVTPADAESLFGAGERARQSDDLDAATVGVGCNWVDADADDLGGLSHLLQVRVFEGEQFYAEATYDETEPLAGIGERAFVAEVDSIGLDVQFVKDGMTVSISYAIINVGAEDSGIGASDRRDELVTLVRRAASRM